MKLDIPIDDVSAAYLSGATLRTLGNTYGCSSGTIKNRLVEHGIELRGNRKFLPDDDIIKQYLDGSSASMIGAKYGTDHHTIINRLCKYGIGIRHEYSQASGECSPFWMDLPEDDICNEYANGASLTDLADKYGCSVSVIKKRLIKNGVDRRDMVECHIGDKNGMYNKHHTMDTRILQSSISQGVEVSEWMGFCIRDHRYYVKPIPQCMQMNNRFVGSEGHHITPSIVAFIPAELHNHIAHNIKTGENMGEINALAIQFINGGL